MQYQAPGVCPVCSHELTISKLQCTHCKTSIEGSFSHCEFCMLPTEDLFFMKTFIKCRGNIKDVEKELGISYPTVKSKLNNLIEALGFHVSELDTKEIVKERQEEKTKIIDALERGEITAKEASEKIAKIK